MTVGAYEKILELISFTDHQDTHSPSFLLQGRDAAPMAPLPHSVSLRSTQMNVHAHARTHILYCNHFRVDSDSDLCGSYVTLIYNRVCRVPCFFLIICSFVLGLHKTYFYLILLNLRLKMFIQQECCFTNGDRRVTLPLVKRGLLCSYVTVWMVGDKQPTYRFSILPHYVSVAFDFRVVCILTYTPYSHIEQCRAEQ